MEKPGKIIQYSQPNIYGNHFMCSSRTAAHLDRTKARLKDKGKSLKIIQGSYNTSVELSAGTHDKDAVLDVEVVGMDWYEAQSFLRQNGWGAWVRTPAEGFSYHIHMISLPAYKLRWVAPVGEYVPGQVTDFYNHEDGLAGGGHDGTWFPKNIRRTIFHYRRYMVAEGIKKKIVATKKQLKRLRDKLKKLNK